MYGVVSCTSECLLRTGGFMCAHWLWCLPVVVAVLCSSDREGMSHSLRHGIGGEVGCCWRQHVLELMPQLLPQSLEL